jgi:hypothetical protein
MTITHRQIWRGCAALHLLWLLSTAAARSQADTAFVALAVAAAHGRYEAAVLEQSTLLVGSAYRESQYTRDQHPFFLADTLQPATILYNGQEYSGVPMLYDMTNQRVLILNPFVGSLIMLVDEKVSGFELGRHEFAKVPGYPGYYEVLEKGDLTALCRRIKTFHQSIIANERVIRYVERSRYYLAAGGRLSVVHHRASLLRHLSSQKKAMREFIEESGLDFDRHFEEALVACVAYYNTLTARP